MVKIKKSVLVSMVDWIKVRKNWAGGVLAFIVKRLLNNKFCSVYFVSCVYVYCVNICW